MGKVKENYFLLQNDDGYDYDFAEEIATLEEKLNTESENGT